MTQIDFYTHVDNKLKTACLLTAKAVSHGLRVMICTPNAELTEKTDKLLWTFSSIGFVPHCRANDKLAEITPVIIDHEEKFLHDQVLLNLRTEYPPFFSRFQRLIEIVSTDEEDRLQARERFRLYRDRGYQIQSHNIGTDPI